MQKPMLRIGFLFSAFAYESKLSTLLRKTKKPTLRAGLLHASVDPESTLRPFGRLGIIHLARIEKFCSLVRSLEI